jgi:hypothetical protein
MPPPTPTMLGACVSRTTRDEGAPIYVCEDCGAREAHQQHGERLALETGMETGCRLVPFTEFPLSVEALLDEDRLRYSFARSGSFRLVTMYPGADDPAADDLEDGDQ